MAAPSYRNTIAAPQERMVGKGEWSIRLRVRRKVNSISSIGPKGVRDQSKSRMRAAISLDPVINVLPRNAWTDVFTYPWMPGFPVSWTILNESPVRAAGGGLKGLLDCRSQSGF